MADKKREVIASVEFVNGEEKALDLVLFLLREKAKIKSLQNQANSLRTDLQALSVCIDRKVSTASKEEVSPCVDKHEKPNSKSWWSALPFAKKLFRS